MQGAGKQADRVRVRGWLAACLPACLSVVDYAQAAGHTLALKEGWVKWSRLVGRWLGWWLGRWLGRWLGGRVIRFSLVGGVWSLFFFWGSVVCLFVAVALTVLVWYAWCPVGEVSRAV